MMRKTLIILVGIAVYICSSVTNSEANPIKANAFRSVLKEINEDSDVCETRKLFNQSNFVKKCDSVEYPGPNVTLQPNNTEQFLCLGVYDRIFRLCHLDSQKGLETSPLPGNAQILDAMIKNSLPKDEKQDMNFCNKWKNPYPPKYLKTKYYVAQLEEALKSPVKCVKLCIDFDAEVHPVCSVLALMDQFSEQYSIKLDNSQKKIEKLNIEANDKTIVPLEVVVPVNENSPPEETGVEAAAKKQLSNIRQKVVEKVSGIENKPGEHGSSIDDTPPLTKSVKEQPEVKTAPENPATKFQESPTAKSQSLVNKPPAVEALAQEVQEKEINIAKTERVEERPNSKPDSNRNPNPASVDSKAPQQPVENLPSYDSSKDISGANQPEDPKQDVISENTQNRDDALPEEEEASQEHMNDLERPITSLTDEAGPPPQKPEQPNSYHRMPIRNDDDSHFFSYFTILGVLCIAGYVGYHNKQKILAMLLEGRRSRGNRGRRRPSTANYRKLDCTLEEAVTSQCNSNVTHVIY